MKEKNISIILRIFALLFVLLAIIFSCAELPDESEKLQSGVISGKVTDATSGTGIIGVTITTNPATQTVTTNSSGDYTITNVTPNNYTIKANKSGYGEGTGSVNVLAGEIAKADILLSVSGAAPNVPILSSPTNGSIDQSISATLSWNTIIGAESYGLQVSTSSNFISFAYNQNGLNGTNKQISGLSNSTTYYWRVNATNGYGTSSFSSVWNFKTISKTNSSPTQPSNPNPVDGAINQETSLTFSWDCSDPDGDPLTYDIYLGTTNNPEVMESNISSKLYTINWQLGEYIKYYWKIIAKDNHGNVTEGDVWEFTTNVDYPDKGEPCPGYPKVYYVGGPNNDSGGDFYYTVQIGDQCWLRENLNVGTMINGSQDQQSGNGIEKYCYDNIESNCDKYGGYYQWDEAMKYSTSDGAQGICPDAWHIPTWGEMLVIRNNDAGKLLETTQITDGYISTNETGFSAIFAGWQGKDEGGFVNLSRDTFFWASTLENDLYPYWIRIFYDTSWVQGGNYEKKYSFSIRCLKN